MKIQPGQKIHTNAIYSASAHGEAFKVITPTRTRLKWARNTKTRIHPNGHLRRRQMTAQELERMNNQ